MVNDEAEALELWPRFVPIHRYASDGAAYVIESERLSDGAYVALRVLSGDTELVQCLDGFGTRTWSIPRGEITTAIERQWRAIQRMQC